MNRVNDGQVALDGRSSSVLTALVKQQVTVRLPSGRLLLMIGI